MRKHAPSLLLLVSFLSGCATAQSPSKVSQLQIQVNELEQKLQARDQEIEELKFTLNNLSSQIETEENYSFGRPVEDLDYSQQRAIKKTLSSSSPKSDEEIIRVPVAAADIQKALKNAGYYSGAIDGKIGSGSKQAIRDFQRENGLKVDGIIGARTWDALKSYL